MSFIFSSRFPAKQQATSFTVPVFRLQVHLLVQLALADLLAALILMCTSAMNKASIDYSVEICQYSLPLSLVSNGHFPFSDPLALQINIGLFPGGDEDDI